MTNQVMCPNCKRIISGNSIIEDASKGEGLASQSLVCECGERISYWQITAQLRNQKKLGTRLQKWFLGLFASR